MEPTEVYQLIQDAITTGGFDIEIQPYSGRGMMGTHCVGVIGHKAEITDMLKDMVSDLIHRLVAVSSGNHVTIIDDEESLQDTEEIEDLITTLCFDSKTDSMGFDIVMYWPQLHINPDM